MATNMFVQFKDIEGECDEYGHPNWCEITSFGQTFENQAAPLPSGQTSAEPRRGKHGDIKINKVIDKASIALMKACWEGKLVPEVVIECFRAGPGLNDRQNYKDPPIKYFSIILENVIIKKFSYKVDEGNLVSEALELVATKATYEYQRMFKKTGLAARAGHADIELGPDDFCDSKVKIGPKAKTLEERAQELLEQQGRGSTIGKSAQISHH